MVVQRTANESLNLTQPITALYDLSHLAGKRSARQRRKKSVLVANMPSTKKQECKTIMTSQTSFHILVLLLSLR